MIDSGKVQNSLKALNLLLVATRRMANNQQAYVDLAVILDVLEYLPRLLADPRDQTQAFRGCIDDLAKRFPEFRSALEAFDAPNLKWPW